MPLVNYSDFSSISVFENHTLYMPIYFDTFFLSVYQPFVHIYCTLRLDSLVKDDCFCGIIFSLISCHISQHPSQMPDSIAYLAMLNAARRTISSTGIHTIM